MYYFKYVEFEKSAYVGWGYVENISDEEVLGEEWTVQFIQNRPEGVRVYFDNKREFLVPWHNVRVAEGMDK